MLNESVIQWLLEDNNPAVKYRTQTEILNIPKNNKDVKKTLKDLLESELIKSVMSLFDMGKEYSDSHAISALAEYGLTRTDIDIDQYIEKFIANINFREGCDGGFLLRNLVMLGYAKNSMVKKEMPLALSTQQSDGGFPCTSKNPKIKKPNVSHKSCFQMTTSYLLLTAEMFKKGINCPQIEKIADYFLGRNILFRHDKPDIIIKKEMSMTFHPPVCTRIGLHMMLCALSILGKGNNSDCKQAWDLLYSKRDNDGKYIIDGSLTKPYIKVEKPGKPSKWVTFYVLLGEKYKSK